MKKIALVAMGLSLSCCTAVTEEGSLRPVAQELRPPSSKIAPAAAVVASPSADPAASILAYHGDLEACRRAASTQLGRSAALDDVEALKRALDDVEALKRALAEGPRTGSVSVSYRSDDLAVRRDRAVKTCLSKRGYVLKD